MAKRGYKLQEFVAHSSNVNCLNIGKKACRLLLTGGDDHKVNLWAIGKPVSLMSLCGHTSPVESVSFDSAEVLVVAGASNGMIKLWDLEEAKLVRALTGHKSNCTAVGFHPFGEFFASGSMDTNLKIWDIRKKGCIHTYKGHTQGIGTIRFSPDGRWVVSGGLDNIVKVWDLTAGKLLHEFKFHEGHIRSIDFHPLEFLLATGSADKTVKFWDLETFELIGSARPEATGVRSIAFHPDGRTLFCGLEDSLKVYSWEPVIRHDAVDIGWSTLGDLCIHDGKVLGCSYYRNSVGVWVADISLIEPYGSGFTPEQNDGRELKFNLKGSHSVEKVGSSIKGLRSMSSDYESKEIKNIYVDSTDGKPIASQRVGSLSSPKVVVHSDSKETSDLSTLKQSPAVGMPKNNGQPFSRSFVVPSVVPPKAVVHPDSKEASDLSTPKQSPAVGMPKNNGQPFSRSFGAPSVGPPKAVVRSDSKETSDLSTPKQSPAVGMPKSNGQPFSRSFVVPSVVPRDSSDGKYSAKLRRESIGTARTNSDNSIKPVHTRRPSSISKVDVGRLSVTDNSESLSNTTSDQEDSSISRNFKTRLVVQDDAKECSDEKNSNTKSDAAEKFENLVSPQTPSSQKNCDDSLNSKRIAPVKIVNGVAVVRGRTRSLVERFERKEPVVIDDDHTNSLSPQVIPETDKPSTMLVLSPQVIPETDKPSTMLRVEPQISGRELASGNDEKVAEDLLQNHDVFLSILRSRLTKLQVVRHFWERNDIKGAISALRKLPDHAVQADVVSVLMEKLDILNLDLFSCLLPVLVGLLGSKMERHITVSLELLLKLVAVFGPVIRSTVSAPRGVGVDLHAEERREWCNQCFIQLQKIQKIIPELARRGGVLTKCALELNLVLQAS